MKITMDRAIFTELKAAALRVFKDKKEAEESNAQVIVSEAALPLRYKRYNMRKQQFLTFGRQGHKFDGD